MQEMRVWLLDQEVPVEEGMATHSRILAWRNPWTEEPDGLRSMGSQRVGHDSSDWAQYITGRILWNLSLGIPIQACRNFTFTANLLIPALRVNIRLTPASQGKKGGGSHSVREVNLFSASLPSKRNHKWPGTCKHFFSTRAGTQNKLN